MENLERLHELESEMRSHEVQCEERWKTNFNRLEDIDEKLQRIEGKVIHAAGALIVFLGGLVITLGLIVLENI